MRWVGWGIAFLGALAIITFMNNRFVHNMIYPAPPISVPEQPPASFQDPDWSLDMHGWLYQPKTGGARQVMLYFHGNGENLETMRRSGQLEDLKLLEIPFLVVDYPGYGRSKGKASEESILQNSTAAVKWLRMRFQNHQIVLCGWSLGGSVAVQTAAKADADGLIALSTWTSLHDVATLHFSEWLVGFTLQERYDALQAAGSIQCPALFIHGEMDDLIPADQGKKVASKIKQSRWILLPSVGHNDLLSQPVVWKEIVQFLKNRVLVGNEN